MSTEEHDSEARTSKYLNFCCIRVEKYRPTILDDVVGNRATIDRLKVIQEDGNCPHLLISVSLLGR